MVRTHCLNYAIAIAIFLLAAASAANAQKIEAIGFKSVVGDPDQSRGLYIDVRSAPMSLGTKQGHVVCAADGAGEVIFELDGTFYAVNGSARSWTDLWVWKGRLLRVIDFEKNPNATLTNNNIAEIITAGLKLCPSKMRPGEGLLSSMARAIVEAINSYPSLSRRSGIVLP